MPAAALIVALLALAALAIGGGLASNAAATGTAETDPMATVTGTFTVGVNPQVTGNDSGVAQHASDKSLTGAEITERPDSWPGSDTDLIWNIVAAVALAEGYNGGPGVAPYDLNNPGDLSPGDEAGQEIGGAPQVHDGSAIICFALAEGGFQALYTKFSNIVNGRSHVYPASMTWAQVAAKFAGNAGTWLTNVTGYLGVTAQSTPAQYVKKV